MSGDNGELQQTPEQLLEDKKKAFETDPDRFVDLNDVILVMTRVPNGVAHWIGPAKRSEFNIVKSETQYQIDNILREMDMVSSKKSSIINPFAKKGAFGKKRF